MVRSLTLDMWTEKQLKQMENGGNRKLHEFFSNYSLNDIYDIKVKYSTKAAEFYRKRNAAQAQNQPFEEEAPDIHVGRTLVDGRKLDANGVPQELTEEEKSQLSPEELAMGGNKLIREESKQAASAVP